MTGQDTEVQRLYRLEFGDPIELMVRMIGVPFGTIALYFYTGQPFVFSWMIGYLAANFAYFLFLRSRRGKPNPFEIRVAHVLFLFIMASFLWMPVWMLLQDDKSLALVGAALVGCLLVCMVKRNETSMFLILGETLLILITFGALLILVLPTLGSFLGGIGMVASWTVLLGYFTQSMLKSRAGILAEEKARGEAVQVQKLAAIGQLAGGVAHDFNNSLTAITGNLDLYEAIEDRSERDEFVKAAKTASAQATSIVKQLLVYARKSPISLEVVDANEPLQGIESLTRHLIPANIAVDIHSISEQVAVKVDRDQVMTALVNLVSNASDAMPKGGKLDVYVDRVRLESPLQVLGGTVLSKGDYVAYGVADTGHGIPSSLMEEVINPFFTTKGVGEGTGLGLSMVATIAETCGGGLQIESSPDGTTVTLFVPQITVEDLVALAR